MFHTIKYSSRACSLMALFLSTLQLYHNLLNNPLLLKIYFLFSHLQILKE